MRLGGSICAAYHSPREWLELVKEAGYTCIVFPVDSRADRKTTDEYIRICRDNDLVIGEVGIWRNLYAKDEKEAAENLEYSFRQLELAEYTGANCCVNISGSMGSAWDGFHAGNYLKSTWDRTVEITQRIIDTVRPEKTCYTLEPMPWMCPDSPEQYLELIRQVDRKQFAVHMDYTNMISGLDRFINNTAFIKKCFTLLAPYIRSVHLKDAIVEETALPCHISEAVPGDGLLDLETVLRECAKLDRDIPVFTEHMDRDEDYRRAVRYLRALGKEKGIEIL